jgi:hypothetical protein
MNDGMEKCVYLRGTSPQREPFSVALWDVL